MVERLGLNLITLRGTPGDGAVDMRLRAAAGAGFKAVGLWMKDLERWETDEGSLEGLVGLLAELQLHVAEICAVRICDGDGKVTYPSEAFRRAAAVRADCVICVYDNIQAPLDLAREQWAEFVEHIAGFRVKAALEFIGTFDAYNTIDAALDVVASGPELGGLVVDTYHLWRGHSDIATLSGIASDQLFLVHLNDAKSVPREQSTDKDRTYPGEGVMPLTHMLSTIRHIGYEGHYDVEIFGECQEQDPDKVAATAYGTACKALHRAAVRRG